MSRLLTKLLPKPLKGGLVPSLDLEFARNRYSMRDNGIYQQVPFEKAMTFSRNSVGYDIVRGALTQFPVNAPRLSERGLAMYGARTNITPTDVMTATQGSIVTTGNTLLDMPERGYIADTTSSLSHWLNVRSAPTTAGNRYSFTTFMRLGSSRYVRIWPANTSNWGGMDAVGIKIDLLLGTVVAKGTALTNVSTVLLPDGIVMISFTALAVTASNTNLVFIPTTSNADLIERNFAGDGTSILYYYYGTTMEEANAPSGVIPAGSTRPSELCQVVLKNTALGGWFNPDVGTILLDMASYDDINTTDIRCGVDLSNPTYTTRITLGISTANGRIVMVSGSMTMRNTGAQIPLGKVRLSARYDVASVRAKINARPTESGVGGISGDMNIMTLGSKALNQTPVTGLFGTIARVRYFPRWIDEPTIAALHAGS